MTDKPRVLCVDDEPHVASGLKLTLRKKFDVTTAASGPEGLEAIAAAAQEEDGPFAVVVSDMRMPEMDGAQFLKIVRHEYPDVGRVLLTGQADMESAIAAVNDAKIFRFLTKPCAPADLIETLTEAAEQQRLRKAERELLEKTLRGSVEMMAELLGLVNISAYNRTQRILQIVQGIYQAMDKPLDWDIEIAVMMSQIGCAVLPDRDADSHRQAEIAAELLARIPRLEGVADMVGRQLADQSHDDQKAEVLRVAVKLEAMMVTGTSWTAALADVAADKAPPARALMAVLPRVKLAVGDMTEVTLQLDQLVPGMELVSDVETATGSKLAVGGTVLTVTLLTRLRSFARAQIVEPITVLAPPTAMAKIRR